MMFRQISLAARQFRSAGVAAAAVLLAGTSVQAQSVLKFHHDLPEDSAQHLGAQRFEELVEERTGGAIDIQIFANNALGDDVEVAQQMQFGAVHAAPIPTAKLSNFSASLQLIDLPFLFPSREITYGFLDSEVGQEILDDLSASGFVGASFWESGFKQLTCNHPVKSPGDLQGRKVRVMESPLLIAQFEELGATAIPVAFSETYSALQQGVVECQENPIVSILKMKFYEVQDDLMVSNHGYLGTAFIFSKTWFDTLDAETQEILLEAAKEAGAYQREQSAELQEDYLQQIRDAGTTEIVELSPDEVAAFSEAMKPVHARFAERIGQDLLDRTYAKIEELGATQ
ncbi:TRAP transporter substrate-binding protein [Lutibaculum baratangense]|uniref:TRAP-type C4-dicarboxylate transport system, periplasmic component n=1 Tax=Lutibaculum baratangense AMV1 TaxID=631454 RepID=V4RC31_9HYPH|nr:TRAP transporter substrate-binding protein [Lutibaculum baratangense]ESR23726.1 TRAP-type C4-dicarboxylate transport system, periplasmic component [Lutibaculum baratangense AMV1]